MATIATPRIQPAPAGSRRLIDIEAILMLCERDVTRYLRERAQLYGSLARTVVWLFVLGAGLRGSITIPGNVSYLAYVFPGMLAMAIIFTALQSAVSVIFDREFGFLKEILVAPIPRPSIAIGKALAGATIATIQGIVIFLFAPLAGVRPGPLALLASVGVMLLTAFGLTAVGLLFAARMTSFEGFGTINNFIVMPLYFASGAQFPLERAPQWMQTLSRFNPLTYAVDLLRGLLIGMWSFDPRFDLLVLAGFALAALTGATFAFSQQD
ncbi:MAG TPA: ABC transporter permease [Thermomicrobiales bacterium]|nr:ABC transporter permease [Thermomicrobiales bacterium]